MVAFAKFGKDWEENGHNFSVRFDVKPEEPTPDGVLEVTYNTPNYGGKPGVHLQGSPVRLIRFRLSGADGGTITLSRLDPRVTLSSHMTQRASRSIRTAPTSLMRFGLSSLTSPQADTLLRRSMADLGLPALSLM